MIIDPLTFRSIRNQKVALILAQIKNEFTMAMSEDFLACREK